MRHFNDELYTALSDIFLAEKAPVTFSITEPWRGRLWSQLSENGFTCVGSDASIEDHAAMAKAVGSNAIGLPLVEVGLARWVIDHAQLSTDENSVVICALPDEDEEVMLEESGGSYQVTGQVRRVPWARNADELLVPAKFGDSFHWVLVDQSSAHITESVNFASEPRDHVMFEGQSVSATKIGLSVPRTIEVNSRGALLRAAAAVGALEYLLDATLLYAEQRVQFGRAISSFQAVQHHIVEIAEAVASVSSAVDSAVFAEPQYRIMLSAAAKAVMGGQVAAATRSAHQVHGAIGVTDEHPLQARTRRLWSWQDEFGSADFWSSFLADQLIFPDAPGAWQVMTPPLADLETRRVSEEVAW